MALRGAWMGFRRRGRPGAEAAERLLDAAAEAANAARQPTPEDLLRQTGDAPEPLARLLSAAAAPARPGELDGEEAAVAAFRAARHSRLVDGVHPGGTDRAAHGGSRKPSPTGWSGRRLTAGVAAWAAAGVATVTAGAALAAEMLVPTPPTPVPAGARPTTTAPATTAPATTESATTEPATTPPPTTTLPTTAPTAPPSVTSPGAHGAGTPSEDHVAPEPSIVGRCRGYLARNAGNGRAPEKPPTPDLVAAAGGAAKVEAYCRKLLGTTANPQQDSSGSQGQGNRNGQEDGNGNGRGNGNGNGDRPPGKTGQPAPPASRGRRRDVGRGPLPATGRHAADLPPGRHPLLASRPRRQDRNSSTGTASASRR